MSDDPRETEREAMEFDVVIVGAGPAGLAASIRLKQLNEDLNVVVLEKGSEVGAHILSGAVIDPIALDRLLPEWRDEDTPIKTPVTDDQFLWLGPAGSMRLPNFAMPPLMSNHGNYIVSLGNVCRWLAEKAEALGVEVYPGFAAAEVLYNEDGSVKGVATGDMGIGRDGEPGPNFTRGMELHGNYTLIGEGVRGSLAKQLIAQFRLDEGKEPAKFGIGLKELWEVDPDKHKPGLVQHSFGWPLDTKPAAGPFCTIWRTIRSPSVSLFTSITKIPIFRHSKSSSALSSTRLCGRLLKAVSAFPMVRVRSLKAGGSRYRNSPSQVAL